MGALSPIHLLIVLAIVVLLFGGSRLAGLGKSSGRALREFKEETKGLRDKSDPETDGQAPRVEGSTSSATTETRVAEPERVENPTERRDA